MRQNLNLIQSLDAEDWLALSENESEESLGPLQKRKYDAEWKSFLDSKLEIMKAEEESRKTINSEEDAKIYISEKDLVQRVAMINGGINLQSAFDKAEESKKTSDVRPHARKVRSMTLDHYRKKYNFPDFSRPPTPEQYYGKYLEENEPQKILDPGVTESWRNLPPEERSIILKKHQKNKTSFLTQHRRARDQALEDRCWLAFTAQEIQEWGQDEDVQDRVLFFPFSLFSSSIRYTISFK